MVNNLDELSGVGHRHPGLQGLVWHMNETDQTKGQIHSHTCEIYGQHTISALELNNTYSNNSNNCGKVILLYGGAGTFTKIDSETQISHQHISRASTFTGEILWPQQC